MPNTENFRKQSGEYIDICYIFKQVRWFSIPIWNYNGRWCGYINSDKIFLKISKDEIVELIGEANFNLPDKPSLPFWDLLGGKIIIVTIFILLGVLVNAATSKPKKK